MCFFFSFNESINFIFYTINSTKWKKETIKIDLKFAEQRFTGGHWENCAEIHRFVLLLFLVTLGCFRLNFHAIRSLRCCYQAMLLSDAIERKPVVTVDHSLFQSAMESSIIQAEHLAHHNLYTAINWTIQLNASDENNTPFKAYHLNLPINNGIQEENVALLNKPTQSVPIIIWNYVINFLWMENEIKVDNWATIINLDCGWWAAPRKIIYRHFLILTSLFSAMVRKIAHR